MAKILIVEDEKNISNLIQDTLSLANYETECAFDGQEAIEKIKKHCYDLILLDIMLPILDGFQVFQKIQNTNTKVIFLSAKDDVGSIVKGLKMGGEDYLTKPFEPLELLARIEIRLGNKKQEKYHYKEIEVCLSERMVYHKSKEIALAPKEYELLILLIQNIDRVLTRNEILNKAWDINAEIETRTVDYHIQQLRKKLDLKNDIITVNKIGYRLEKEE